jgi:hypothetical protein
MRVRSAREAEERSLQEKSPTRVRQLTPSAGLRDQSHDSRTTRRVQGWWTGAILEPSIQADAAERPEERRDFDSWNRSTYLPDLAVRRSSAPSRSVAAQYTLLILEPTLHHPGCGIMPGDAIPQLVTPDAEEMC